MATMRISQLAERSGVPATTLRYYETEGLLPAARTPAGYRTYGPEALDQLAFISAAKQLGLALEEIRDLLTVWRDGPCVQVRANLRPMIAARLAEAEQRTAHLAAFTTSLRDALDRLDALPDRHTSCDPTCPFLTGRPVPVSAYSPWTRILAEATRTPIPGGWRLTLPSAHAPAVAELALAEQRGNPHLTVRLDLRTPTLHLELTTDPAHAHTIDALVAPAQRTHP
ncbi:MerR family transcriptional regulator [Actinocorallia sp. A-T 12471]|uniref:MerR family transcriptional regulator n=1 Tax=Actinocorallia sp. A-T 12471 TaxID=3089813 RepID=UPI0029D36B5B|nr:MerR family transcriptional regulator [Actinocorallia sp. A-T 12471]MDX6740698.1 MerR family transcriptional regulator [Actinocorallia sp. A-T 12471]